MTSLQNRRHFLAGLTATGATGLACSATPARAEPPPETTTVRLALWSKLDCLTPIYISEPLLRAEGFTDIQFVTEFRDPDWYNWLRAGDYDFEMNYPVNMVMHMANYPPVKVLAGMHAGCLELIADRHIDSVKELKGKRVGITQSNSSTHMLLVLMAANVGLDPDKDIEWVIAPSALEQLAEGKIDAFLSSPPEPQMARARGIGHSILKTTLDRPWSQYFCCMLAGNADYVSRYPVATKRTLRALLKAVDICRSDPTMAARQSAGKGFASTYDFAVQTLSEARYDTWREYDPEDSLRFYALRMQETGIIDKNPNDIIADGTDWRFLNELKREMKA